MYTFVWYITVIHSYIIFVKIILCFKCQDFYVTTKLPFWIIKFYSILFYSILFYSNLIYFILLYSIQLFLIFGRPCHFTLCHTVTAAGPSKLHPRQESVNWSTWQATALSGDEAVERTQRRSAVLGHCSPPVLQQTQLSTDVSVSGWRYCYVRDNIYCVIIFVWNIHWRRWSKSIWDNGILKRNFLKDKQDAFYNV